MAWAEYYIRIDAIKVECNQGILVMNADKREGNNPITSGHHLKIPVEWSNVYVYIVLNVSRHGWLRSLETSTP